jgi:hypothetical protein
MGCRMKVPQKEPNELGVQRTLVPLSVIYCEYLRGAYRKLTHVQVNLNPCPGIALQRPF